MERTHGMTITQKCIETDTGVTSVRFNTATKILCPTLSLLRVCLRVTVAETTKHLNTLQLLTKSRVPFPTRVLGNQFQCYVSLCDPIPRKNAAGCKPKTNQITCATLLGSDPAPTEWKRTPTESRKETQNTVCTNHGKEQQTNVRCRFRCFNI